MEPAIYIVSGIPGAGKTTVSRLLAGTFERGVHIEADVLQRFIIRGGLWPNQEPQGGNGQPVTAITTGHVVLRGRLTPVIDDVVIDR
jgi:predicted ATPase